MLILTLLLACAGDPKTDDTAAGTTDVRVNDVPEPPSPGLQILGPEVVIPAYTDRMFCVPYTYTGEDVGVHEYDAYQGQFGHHIIALQFYADPTAWPDGEAKDCTDSQGELMSEAEPVIIAPTFGAGENLFTLPDGMAASLKSGTRLLLQSHYLNTSAADILVRDVVNLGFIPKEEVEVWAAPYALTRIDLDLPPGQSSTVDFDCSFERDYNLLMMFGHMHEWGQAFKAESVEGDALETLYEVPTWTADYRDAPPVTEYGDTPLFMAAGSTIRTTCTWFNDTDAALGFPNEMCATSGMLYPSKVPVICSD